MIFQIRLIHHLMNKSGCIFDTCSICRRIRSVQCKMKMEVGECFFQFKEIIKIKNFIQCPCTIKIMHFSVMCSQCLCHMHYLCSQRSHSGSTAYPYHFFLRIKMRMEFSVRSTHKNLISRLQREYIRRCDTWIDIHKSAAIRLEWRCRNSYCQHKHITFCRIVCHRICPYCRLRVYTFQ